MDEPSLLISLKKGALAVIEIPFQFNSTPNENMVELFSMIVQWNPSVGSLTPVFPSARFLSHSQPHESDNT